MTRNDYNLIAAVLRAAIDEGKAQPILALHMMEAFLRRGDREPHFFPQDFINRCVRETKRGELPKIAPRREQVERHVFDPDVTGTLCIHCKGPELAPFHKKAPVRIEDNAALFTAILAVEFPHLKDSISCALTVKQPNRFSIGRVGGKVWIRFGGPAMSDPIGAVKAAVPDAEAMLRGTTTATQINGR
jgi:hypothetical protein